MNKQVSKQLKVPRHHLCARCGFMYEHGNTLHQAMTDLQPDGNGSYSMIRDDVLDLIFKVMAETRALPCRRVCFVGVRARACVCFDFFMLFCRFIAVPSMIWTLILRNWSESRATRWYVQCSLLHIGPASKNENRYQQQLKEACTAAGGRTKPSDIDVYVRGYIDGAEHFYGFLFQQKEHRVTVYDSLNNNAARNRGESTCLFCLFLSSQVPAYYRSHTIVACVLHVTYYVCAHALCYHGASFASLHVALCSTSCCAIMLHPCLC